MSAPATSPARVERYAGIIRTIFEIEAQTWRQATLDDLANVTGIRRGSVGNMIRAMARRGYLYTVADTLTICPRGRALLETTA